MSGDVGLTMDEKIRRSLEPLGGPLRIDAFLTVMAKERARRGSAKAHPRSDARSQAPQAAPVAQAVETTGPELIVLPREGEPAPPGAEPPDLSDSTKLKAEVAAFMKRDQINDATAGEVADYKDYMGPQGFDPEQMGE